MTDEIIAELARFQAGEFDPAAFPHRDHVRIGFELLRRHVFTDAAHRFSTGLRAMASNAGRPEAYHDTITLAFLSLIAERSAGDPHPEFAGFEQANPDLLHKHALLKWYDSERLMSPLARQTFVLPTPASVAA